MVDGGSLENCCTETYRGFESLRLRKADATKHPLFFAFRLCRNSGESVKGDISPLMEALNGTTRQARSAAKKSTGHLHSHPTTSFARAPAASGEGMHSEASTIPTA